MRCPRCDSELEEGQKFCHKCGMRMEVRPEEK